MYTGKADRLVPICKKSVTMKKFIFVLVIAFTSTYFLQAYEYHWSEVLGFPLGCSVVNKRYRG
jgi:hypothetical protein